MHLGDPRSVMVHEYAVSVQGDNANPNNPLKGD